jgi:hypothetical protein
MEIKKNGSKFVVVDKNNNLLYSSSDYNDCLNALVEFKNSLDNNVKLENYKGKYLRCVVQHLYGDQVKADAYAEGFYFKESTNSHDVYCHPEYRVLRYINKVSKKFHEKYIP